MSVKSSSGISLADAVAARLLDRSPPAVTLYQLSLLTYQTFSDKGYDGRKLSPSQQQRYPRPEDVSSIRRDLLNRGIVRQEAGLPETVLVPRSSGQPSPDQIVCAADPFAFISHLSAMAFYGLTNRLPKILYVTSPAAKEWSARASTRMQRDLGEQYSHYLDCDMPKLHRPRLARIRGTTIQSVNGAPEGAFAKYKEQQLRVATIGRTFLDMLRRPDLCGGFSHVLEAFEQHAQTYLSLIVNELDQHGRKLDRVRAGYILEERCGLEHEAFERWRADTQRGGSQKLNPKAEFSPTYSVRWSLSINEPG